MDVVRHNPHMEILPRSETKGALKTLKHEVL